MIVVNARLEGRNVRARVVAGRMQDGPFAAQREAFRAGRGRWDGAAASWLVPVESWPLVRRKLEESGHFKIGIGADIGGPLLPVAEPPKKSASLAPEIAERAALYPYQVEGASWLLSRYAEGRGAVLADDMGLGKTRQALAALGSSGATLGLVVCPAIARGVWKAEAEKVLPGWRVLEKSTEAEGERLWNGVPDEPCIVVVSYNCLPPVREDGTNWPGSKAGAAPREGIVIADEAHMLKSSKSDRTRRFRALARSAKRAGPGSELAIWTLTGTPVLNEPSDLWSLYQCAGVAKEAWPEGFWSFADAHGGRKNRRGHLEWEGIPDGRAKTRFRNVASRRLKTEVLALPPKTKRDVIVSLTDEERAFLDGVDKKAIDKTGLVISSLTAVRAAISQGPKTRAAIAWIRQFQAERPGEPIVVFASHKQSVEAIANALGFAKILGSVRAQERAEIVRRFQAGELAGVVGTIQAMGVGVTLTRADTVLFLESDWTPELNEQAEDRLYRIGQTRPVTVARLIADHEIDRKIEELCEFKESVHAAVLDLPADYFAKSKARSIEELRRELDARREGEAAAAREATAAREAARSALDAVVAREAAEKARQEGEAAERELSKSRTRRGPESDLERWAAEGLASVAAADGDRAAHRNDVGFSKFDGAFGHDLVRAISGGGLTAAQWRAAVKLANKYSGQIGDKPEARAEKAEQVSESESTKTQDEDGDEARRARFAAHWREWELTLPQTSGRRAKAIAKKAESISAAVHASQLKKEQNALAKELRELLESSPGLPAGFGISAEKLLALHERFRGMNERIRKARYEAQDFFTKLDDALKESTSRDPVRRDTARALRARIEALLAQETHDTFVFGEAAQVLRRVAREDLENGRVPAGNVRGVLSFFARGGDERTAEIDDHLKAYGNGLPASPDYYEWEPLIPSYRAEKQERIEKIEKYERQRKAEAARLEELEQERKLKEQKEREEREDAQRRVIAEARAHNASLKALGSAGKASRFFGVGWGVKAEYDGRIYWPFALGRALDREGPNKGWYVIHLPTGLSARHGLKKGEALAAVKRVVEGKLHLDPRGEADTPEALAKSGYLQELGRALTGEESAKANHYAEDAFEQSARSEERERAERERAERERAERERAERERAERERAEREQEKNRIALEKGASLDKLQGADGIAHYWTAGNSKSVPGNLSLCGEQWRENSGPDAWRGDVKECAKCVAVLKGKREREQEARIAKYEEARRARNIILDADKQLEGNAVAFFYVGGDENEGDPESIALRKGDVPLKEVEKYLERRLGAGSNVQPHGSELKCQATGYDGKVYSYTTPVKVEARKDKLSRSALAERKKRAIWADKLSRSALAERKKRARATKLIWADKLSRSVLAERKKRARANKLAPWAGDLSRNVAEQRKFNQALRGGWNRAAVWSAADGRQVTGFVFWPLGYGSPGAEEPAIWNLPEGEQLTRSAPDTPEHRARAVKLAESVRRRRPKSEKAGEAVEKKIKTKKEPKASARKEEDMKKSGSGRVAVGNQYMIVVGRQHVQAEVTGKDEDGWIVARTDTGRQMRRRRTTAELKKCECTKECAE